MSDKAHLAMLEQMLKDTMKKKGDAPKALEMEIREVRERIRKSDK